MKNSQRPALPAELHQELLLLRQAARQQRQLSSAQKNKTLLALAAALVAQESNILAANKVDLENLSAETAPAFRDRLLLNSQRIAGMAESLKQVAQLPDPVGEMVEQRTLNNGLLLKKVRSPLGVLLMIFESRPNVILEAFSLAFKSGNAILLRGGSESRHTAQVIYKLMQETLTASGLLKIPFGGLENYDRGLVETLLQRPDLIDVVIPRGGDKLIEFVQNTALMPIIKNDRGMCHCYVDDEADLAMAVKIIANAKVQRPGVCNSLETILLHKSIAAKALPDIYQAMEPAGVQWRVDETCWQILQGKALVQKASTQAWDTEYLDLIVNCRVVAGLEEAMEHIETHGSRHSEVIVTKSEKKARLFQEDVDAAAVYWNASSRFTDGFEFGLGGELGISTQKLHVRGPVGLRELTTPRWWIDGNGQIRA